jgi:hypothetical protein
MPKMDILSVGINLVFLQSIITFLLLAAPAIKHMEQQSLLVTGGS